MKAILLAAALLSLPLAAAPASACCHILYLREDVGPCYVEWEGDALRGETEYAEAGCLGESTRVTP